MILKVVSATENMGGNDKIILLTFLHAFQRVLKLKHRTVVCSGPHGAEIQMWKSVLEDVSGEKKSQNSLREFFFLINSPRSSTHSASQFFPLPVDIDTESLDFKH